MDKIKRWLKQLLCRHYRAGLVRWHWCHGLNGNEPATVEAEYRCDDCGKLVYMHLGREESFQWASTMGHYKQDGGHQ